MSLISQVSTGIKPRPHFISVYGPGGIGKTTFAANAPNPLFFGTDDGSDHMDVSRLPVPKTWADVKAAVSELIMEDHPFETLVIDTINGFEPLVWAHVCKESSVASIEDVDGGFGKGYIRAEEEWIEFYKSLKRLRSKMNVIILGHSKVKGADDLYQGERYDRNILKMDARASDLMVEAVDCVFFAAYEQIATKKKGEQKIRMRGVGRRRMFTEQRPAFVAKSRFDIPFEMDLSWQAFVDAVALCVPKASTDELTELFKGREDAATAYLVNIGWLIEGQKLSDLRSVKRKPILSRKEEFLKAVDDFSTKQEQPETELEIEPTK